MPDFATTFDYYCEEDAHTAFVTLLSSTNIPQSTRATLQRKYGTWRRNNGEDYWVSRKAFSRIKVSTKRTAAELVTSSEHVAKKMIQEHVHSTTKSPSPVLHSSSPVSAGPSSPPLTSIEPDVARKLVLLLRNTTGLPDIHSTEPDVARIVIPRVTRNSKRWPSSSPSLLPSTEPPSYLEAKDTTSSQSSYHLSSSPAPAPAEEYLGEPRMFILDMAEVYTGPPTDNGQPACHPVDRFWSVEERW